MNEQNTTALGSVLRDIPAELGPDTVALNSAPVFAKHDTPPSWLPQILTRVGALADLGENWDSYGGRAIDGRSIAAAQRLIDHLARFIGVNAPAVSGTPDGGVGFSWDDGDWSLDAEVLRCGRINYVYLDEKDSAKDRETSKTDGNELLELLTQWR